MASLSLMPVAASRERWSGPPDYYVLPNRIGRILWSILLALFVGGLWFQEYPHPEEGRWGPFEPGQVFAAFARVFGLT